MNKEMYEKIAKAIIRKSNKEISDYRPLLRKWIELFEETRVQGFNRDDFLDVFQKELEKGNKDWIK